MWPRSQKCFLINPEEIVSQQTVHHILYAVVKQQADPSALANPCSPSKMPTMGMQASGLDLVVRAVWSQDLSFLLHHVEGQVCM